MSPSLTLACLWTISACIPAMFPSKRKHWPLAYVLMATGLPILVLIYIQHGAWITLACLIAALSILRWPMIYTLRWLKKRLASNQ